jgi:hypothetical protein
MSRQILEQVCAELIECAAVTNSSEFCKNWLAKDESYLRVLKFHKIDASADALATCASKLGYYSKHLAHSNKPVHQDWCTRFTRLQYLCQATLEQQARAKWMTPERMGL